MEMALNLGRLFGVEGEGRLRSIWKIAIGTMEDLGYEVGIFMSMNKDDFCAKLVIDLKDTGME